MAGTKQELLAEETEKCKCLQSFNFCAVQAAPPRWPSPPLLHPPLIPLSRKPSCLMFTGAKASLKPTTDFAVASMS